MPFKTSSPLHDLPAQLYFFICRPFHINCQLIHDPIYSELSIGPSLR